MSFRERMLHIIQGGIPEGLLFVPRLDIWHNWHKAHGSLPSGFEASTPLELSERLGVGFHSVVPDFIRSAPEKDIYHRGLGFYNHPDSPYRVDFSEVDFKVDKTDTAIQVTYHGQSRSVSTRFKYGEEVLNSGVSVPDMLENPIKEEQDYSTLAEIFSRVKVLPRPEAYRAYHKRVGDRGLAVAFVSLAAGPMQHIMRDLRKFDQFCLDKYDCPHRYKELCEPLGAIYMEMLQCAAECCAEVVLFGANYDDTITYPPFFEEHIAPWLNRAAGILNPAGKHLLTHTDGENFGLLKLLRQCTFDVADSICPAPMTKVSLREYRDNLSPEKTIWGGCPSVLLLKHCSGDEQFTSFVRNMIRECRPYDHFILSVADTLPPDADFGRVLFLCEECARTFSGPA